MVGFFKHVCTLHKPGLPILAALQLEHALQQHTDAALDMQAQEMIMQRSQHLAAQGHGHMNPQAGGGGASTNSNTSSGLMGMSMVQANMATLAQQQQALNTALAAAASAAQSVTGAEMQNLSLRDVMLLPPVRSYLDVTTGAHKALPDLFIAGG